MDMYDATKGHWGHPDSYCEADYLSGNANVREADCLSSNANVREADFLSSNVKTLNMTDEEWLNMWE